MRAVPTPTSFHTSVTGTSQQIDAGMEPDTYWVFTSSVPCLIKQGDDPTAAASDGSTFLGAGQSVMLDGSAGSTLAVIRVGGTSGEATLTRAKVG